MKFIRLYIIIAAFTGMLMSPAGAQPEGELTLEPVRNPFIPQLPEKPKIDETAAAQTQTQTQNQNQQNQGSVRTPNAEKGRPTVKKAVGRGYHAGTTSHSETEFSHHRTDLELSPSAGDH